MTISKHLLTSLSIAAAMTLTTLAGCSSGGGGSEDAGSSSSVSSTSSSVISSSSSSSAAFTGVTSENKTAFLEGYAKVAQLSYNDALDGAKNLKTALEAFVTDPTETTFEAAKAAWKQSREQYTPSEIFRLSEGPIDAEEGWVAEAYGALEGQLNAWPLDENMIDYTINDEGQQTSGNIIDTVGMFTPSGDESAEVNVTNITVEAITALNENGGEANVATGYHAIEFLLWGQDQDYQNGMIVDDITHGPTTAGQRPLTDYTTDANAERRRAYLLAAVEKLIADLQVVADAWADGVDGDKGKYRAAFLGELTGDDAQYNLTQTEALINVFSGMGTFVKSELANERIAIAVLDPSEEDEHSCFSDETHRDILLDFEGFQNVMKNEYPAGNGLGIAPAVSDMIDPATTATIEPVIEEIVARVADIDAIAKGEDNTLNANAAHFDWQVRGTAGDETYTATADNIVAAKNKMRALGDLMVDVAADFGVNLSAEDVTDPDETEGYE